MENTFLKAKGSNWGPESLGFSWHEHFKGRENQLFIIEAEGFELWGNREGKKVS